MEKVVLVTGGSSGIGREACRALVQKGCRVYELSRHSHQQPGVTHLTADVTDRAAVSKAVNELLTQEGHIDALINCAGFGISGAVEFTEPEAAKRQFDVNFFGMAEVTACVLEPMRRAGKGRIVNVSSVAAVAPIPFQTYYSAAKAAVNSYTMALANEVRPFGIQVCAVMPGDIQTGFTAAREKSVVGDDVYNGRVSRSVGRMEHDEQTGMPASRAGEYIARAALRRRSRPLMAIGIAYKAAALLVKLLPAAWANRLLGALYAS